MNETRRIGIIDIGSNSVRLVIYAYTQTGANRVLGEWKESARLSERIRPDGVLPPSEAHVIVPVLLRFLDICSAHETSHIRTVATAAIRNAANSGQIVSLLSDATGMLIEVLTGEEEGRYGFLGVLNTIDVRDGFLIDIGGGSTEVTLFRNRKLVRSVSFPFGAVNTSRSYTSDGEADTEQLLAIRRMVENAAAEHAWLRSEPGLPLIGLGGTVRTLGKIDQKRRKYPFAQAHNYPVGPASVEELLALLPAMPVERRKKIDGLSKERADIIVPGLVILHTLFGIVQATAYIVSGAGLRDGLFYEAVCPEKPLADDVLDRSVNILLELNPFIPRRHADHVARLAVGLFDDLLPLHGLEPRARTMLSAAARLYKLGTAVHYYQYNRHTFYMIAYSRLDGLSHRELLLCAAIASYKTKNRIHQTLLPFKEMLTESDEWTVAKLGSLLQLAIALDKSETQPVEKAEADVDDKKVRLRLRLRSSSLPLPELKEAESAGKELQKIWGLKLDITY